MSQYIPQPLPPSIVAQITTNNLPLQPFAISSSSAILQLVKNHPRRASALAIALTAVSTLAYTTSISNSPSSTTKKIELLVKDSEEEKGPLRIDKRIVKVSVDKKFWKQLYYIWKICVPTLNHKTVGILSLHTIFLVLRTYLSVLVARLDGKLVRDLVAGDKVEFLKGLGYWFAIAIPATYTNSMIRYLQSKFAMNLRTSLTRHVHDTYMSKMTYYKAGNLDHRIDGADQLITTDINRFCVAAANLYSNLGKPTLDLVIFNYQLAKSIGTYGFLGILINYWATSRFIQNITPPFGKLAAEEAKLEGDFRSAHSRLITNSEEIAFYNGGHLERSILNRTYSRLMRHVNRIYYIRIGYNMFEDFIIKYCWSAFGLIMAAIPIFYPELAGSHERVMAAKEKEESEQGGIIEKSQTMDKATGRRTEGFITNKRLMVSLADAGGRLVYAGKDLSELAGYTYRVYNMLRVLHDLRDDKYVQVENASSVYSIEDVEGVIEYHDVDEGIKLHKVPIVTPSGDTVLVNELTLEIHPTDHLMITGANGAGKSAIIRVIAGLWPLFRGRLARPQRGVSNIFFVPQRPYLVQGTMRDQVIYPHSHAQMLADGKTDQDLMEILKMVYLEYVVTREGGFDVVKEWKDVFSGGEKQRMQIARLFYHAPRFAVLDEATSAVSSDVEALMYTTAKDLDITIVTISHRPALFKYHRYLLRLADGAYTLERIGTGESLIGTVGSEIKKLEEQLKGLDDAKWRLEEVNEELNLSKRGGVGSKGGDGLENARRTLI
ncbi:hypothetical protein SmJEL517_g06070 [Synchytrium microbalum]|uniref:ABC transporter domain-containing protein n=1 Tax=Synchytrium microbalum TaxID=1806994 RepID=A0A507BKI2_9FUNG|nr:uncharacterized protein SmJEL517_g06070 [Synchytrium microbalum]TPX30347.1 hypothetical protein SmJEL517_g06070 [Synchytrium microbalum]